MRGGGCRMLTRAKLGLAPDDFAVLAVGELNANKNHRVLVEAMAELPANVKLFIAGVGSLHDELLALAARLGVSDRVTLLGYRSDIPALLNACDLFCMPSKREGLGMSQLEAMASSLPCIASKTAGSADLLAGMEQFIVADGRPESYASAIRMAYNFTPAERRCVSEKMFETSRNFSVGRSLAIQERVYRELEV